MPLRIKICGITRVEDAAAASQAGANAVGLIFAGESKRRVTPAQATAIAAAVPAGVDRVGVFVDESPVRIRELVASVGLTAVQLHGDEPPAAVAELAGVTVIKAMPVAGPEFAEQLRAYAAACRKSGAMPAAFLLDTASAGQYGGTGQSFDWSWAAQARAAGKFQGLPPIILAGGLTPANVAEAVRIAAPDGVDTAGGVESAPGVKDAAKVAAFCAAARRAGDGK
jgi:phosphoribosylanthranilate isomerase